MIKIDNTSAATKASLRRLLKSSRAGGSGFASAVGGSVETEELSQVSGPAPMSSMLFMQEVNERQTAKDQGDKILNLLDQLRFNILTGDMNDQHLLSLQHNLKNYGTSFSDPRLKEILAEIEQRANIELAKRGLI